LDESPSQINPKLDLNTPKAGGAVQFQISDFGFEMGFRPI
jgi:hypothetical protein